MAPDPWTRQPYDTEDSWPIFEAYRDQVPPRRALTILVRGRAISPVDVSRWMREHYWNERVTEYDRHLDAIRIKVRTDLLAQASSEVMADYMATLATGRAIVAKEMEKLRLTVDASNGEVLRPRDMIHMMETIVKMDRLIRGETTEKIETGPDLSHLSNDELAKLEAMLTPANDAPAVH